MAMRLAHSQRLRIIGNWLIEILKRYTPPSGMDDNRLKEELTFIAEDVNANISSNVNERELKLVLEKLHTNARNKSYPLTCPPIQPLGHAAKAAGATGMRDWPAFPRDEHFIAKAIHRKESIPETYLFGQRCLDLIAESDITEADLAPYRDDFFNKIEDVYGRKAANKIRAEREEVHRILIESTA